MAKLIWSSACLLGSFAFGQQLAFGSLDFVGLRERGIDDGFADRFAQCNERLGARCAVGHRLQDRLRVLGVPLIERARHLLYTLLLRGIVDRQLLEPGGVFGELRVAGAENLKLELAPGQDVAPQSAALVEHAFERAVELVENLIAMLGPLLGFGQGIALVKDPGARNQRRRDDDGEADDQLVENTDVAKTQTGHGSPRTLRQKGTGRAAAGWGMASRAAGRGARHVSARCSTVARSCGRSCR